MVQLGAKLGYQSSIPSSLPRRGSFSLPSFPTTQRDLCGGERSTINNKKLKKLKCCLIWVVTLSRKLPREKCSGICDSTIWTPIIEVKFLVGTFEIEGRVVNTISDLLKYCSAHRQLQKPLRKVEKSNDNSVRSNFSVRYRKFVRCHVNISLKFRQYKLWIKNLEANAIASRTNTSKCSNIGFGQDEKMWV